MVLFPGVERLIEILAEVGGEVAALELPHALKALMLPPVEADFVADTGRGTALAARWLFLLAHITVPKSGMALLSNIFCSLSHFEPDIGTNSLQVA